MILVITEVMCILLDPLEECFIVVDRLIHALFVFVEVSLIYVLKVIQITMNTLIGLFVFEFDVIEQLFVASYLLSYDFEVCLNTLHP